ncbi:MAG: 50S ribosomal protein L32 [Clostridia bacterium]
MALPKSKISKARKHSRSANWKLTTPNLTECPKCHELKQSHTACSSCGFYKDEAVIVKKEKKAQ